MKILNAKWPFKAFLLWKQQHKKSYILLELDLDTYLLEEVLKSNK